MFIIIFRRGSLLILFFMHYLFPWLFFFFLCVYVFVHTPGEQSSFPCIYLIIPILCFVNCVWLFASILLSFVVWTCVLGLFDDAHRHIHSL